MKKEVYSLVLSENVVAAVDRTAKERGVNRSALINQILAEYVSYVTPEMRMKNTLAIAGEQLRAQAAFRVGEPGAIMTTSRSTPATGPRPIVPGREFAPVQASID